MDIPKAMIDAQVDQMVNDFAQRIQAQGLSLEQYLEYTGGTVAALNEQMQPQALKQIQTRLVLEKIAEVENIEISEEKFQAEVENMAKMYNMEADKIMEIMGESGVAQMKKDMAVQEAVTLVADAAVEA